MSIQPTIDDDPPNLADLEPSEVIGYRRIDPPAPAPVYPMPVGQTVQQARMDEVKAGLARLFRPIWNIAKWIVLGLGSALFTGGVGVTLQRDPAGPVFMALGGFLIGMNVPHLLRRSN